MSLRLREILSMKKRNIQANSINSQVARRALPEFQVIKFNTKTLRVV